MIHMPNKEKMMIMMIEEMKTAFCGLVRFWQNGQWCQWNFSRCIKCINLNHFIFRKPNATYRSCPKTSLDPQTSIKYET